MRITPQCVSEILERADVVEVVEDFVSLKKKGQNHWACCPFHNEKSSSFSVSQAKQIYKCFGCGKAGSAVNFVMEIQKASYPEALKYLANKYNINLEYEQYQTDEQQEAQTQRESVLIAMNFAKNHFKNLLKTQPEGISVGQAYFKERGFSPQTVEAFELGYSLPLWDNLLQTARNQQFADEILEQSGLILRNEQGKIYDRFRGRVMFPILDLAGKTIAFGARSLKKDEQPKYLNSPETPVYTKGEMLYGLFQARNEIRKKDNCYLTEGYTDVISMYQAGIQNVVASLGTSLTEKQIRLIKRFTENVTVLYDGDSAGIKASLRGIDMILAEGLNIKVVLFPEGEDPDSYCQKLSALDFQAFLEKNSQDFITFKTQLYLQEAQGDPLKKATAIREIVQSISKIPDAIKRSVFYQQCSELLGVSEEVLISEGNKLFLKDQDKKYKEKEQENKRTSPKISLPPFDVPDAAFESLLQGSEIPAPEYFGQEFEIPTEAELLERPEKTDKNKPEEHSFSNLQKAIRNQEKESLRLLLKYGQMQLNVELKVWQYLFTELEEMEYHTEEYRNILELYREKLVEGIEVDADWLKNHFSIQNDPQSVSMIIHLETEKYEMSENWEKMHEIVTQKETDVLPDALYKHCLRRKLLVVKEMMKETIGKLSVPVSPEEEQELLIRQINLTQINREICQELGIVVSGRY